MLEKVRQPRRARSFKMIIAYILFGLICFSFVFLGLTPDRAGFDNAGAAAYVNGTVISIADYRQTIENLERQAEEQLKMLPAAQRQDQVRKMREDALRGLVDSLLRSQAAQKAGIYVPDVAVRDQIVNIPAFQEDGRFDRSRYDQYLAYVRSTPGEFEKKVRADLLDGQLQRTFFKVLKNPRTLQVLDHQLRETKLNIEVAQIDLQNLKSSSPTDAEAKAFLATTEGRAEAQKYYDENKSEFTSKAEVQARHILVKPKADANGQVSDAAWDEALKTIKKYKEEAKSADFAELAEKYSEDLGSKSRKGDLGYFGRGVMAQEFEEAAFTQPIGQVGEPVRTMFGYHLIKVENRRGGEVKPFAEAELQAAKGALSKSSRTRFTAELEETLKAGKSLDKLFSSQGIKWVESGEFDLSARYIPNVGDHRSVIEAALSLKKPGEVYSQLVHSNGQSYVVRLKSLKAAKPFNDKEAGITFSMGAMEVLRTWSQKVREASRVSLNQRLLQ